MFEEYFNERFGPGATKDLKVLKSSREENTFFLSVSLEKEQRRTICLNPAISEDNVLIK